MILESIDNNNNNNNNTRYEESFSPFATRFLRSQATAPSLQGNKKEITKNQPCCYNSQWSMWLQSLGWGGIGPRRLRWGKRRSLYHWYVSCSVCIHIRVSVSACLFCRDGLSLKCSPGETGKLKSYLFRASSKQVFCQGGFSGKSPDNAHSINEIFSSLHVLT